MSRAATPAQRVRSIRNDDDAAIGLKLYARDFDAGRIEPLSPG